jgi:hypothetical protein
MTFAYICLFTRKINILELNFKRRNITTDWHLCWGKCLLYSWSNRGGKVNNELHIYWTNSTPTANQLQLCLNNPRRKLYSNTLSLFNDI